MGLCGNVLRRFQTRKIPAAAAATAATSKWKYFHSDLFRLSSPGN